MSLKMKLYYFIFYILFHFISQSECVHDGIEVDDKDLSNFKYEVGILAVRKGEAGLFYKCGGGILNDWYILTAAHCFVADDANDIADHDSITIRASTLLNRKAAHEGSLVREAEKIFVPTVFFTVRNADIAIVKLKTKFNVLFSTKLKGLTLPDEDYATLDLNAVLAGYGANKFIRGKPYSDGKLRKMDVTIIPDESRDPIFISGIPSDRSRGSPRGFCDGDSGSPLVVRSKFLGITNYVVIGVAKSNNDDCNDFNQPGIYTRVSAYLDFIEDVKNEVVDDSITPKDVSASNSCAN